MKDGNRTHGKKALPFKVLLEEFRERIISRGGLEHASVDDQLRVLESLSEFPLGRFILENRGANGFWTDYMVSHPKKGRISGVNIEGNPFNVAEDFLLNRCPVVLAHQERFSIFQRLIQKELKEGCTLVSVPCGLMRDLLDLDFTGLKEYKLVGVDIDEESLLSAAQIAKEKSIGKVEFFLKDAWQMTFHEEVDLLTSSGLNVYEDDPSRLSELYSRFFDALKPGGVLVTSVLTYPPGEKAKTDWILENIPQEDLLMDQIIHKDILDVKWRNFRSSNNLIGEFEAVGFSNISTYFDRNHIFPTIFARKPFV